jgi:hypothetical protein
MVMSRIPHNADCRLHVRLLCNRAGPVRVATGQGRTRMLPEWSPSDGGRDGFCQEVLP